MVKVFAKALSVKLSSPPAAWLEMFLPASPYKLNAPAAPVEATLRVIAAVCAIGDACPRISIEVESDSARACELRSQRVVTACGVIGKTKDGIAIHAARTVCRYRVVAAAHMIQHASAGVTTRFAKSPHTTLS